MGVFDEYREYPAKPVSKYWEAKRNLLKSKILQRLRKCRRLLQLSTADGSGDLVEQVQLLIRDYSVSDEGYSVAGDKDLSGEVHAVIGDVVILLKRGV